MKPQSQQPNKEQPNKEQPKQKTQPDQPKHPQESKPAKEGIKSNKKSNKDSRLTMSLTTLPPAWQIERGKLLGNRFRNHIGWLQTHYDLSKDELAPIETLHGKDQRNESPITG